MKLRNILFLLLEAGIAIAGIVHTAVRYCRIAQNPETSFPAETAFFLLIPYVLGLMAISGIWFAVNRFSKRK